ncbi:MAG: thioredoxin family protein [Candidatus Binatia bacterium]|nr:thioredoxin family protein [Candidatus Binatia bacterium]
MRNALGLLLSLSVLAWAIALGPRAVSAGAEDWNDAKIQWRSYEDGLAEAKNQGKPVCLIFYTTWCPHCANYSRVFQDDRIVEQAKKLVMIRVDADKRRDLSDKYKPDGAYIPRTFFLSPSGELDLAIEAGRAQFKFFYDEHDAGHVLKAMQAASEKYARK